MLQTNFTPVVIKGTAALQIPSTPILALPQSSGLVTFIPRVRPKMTVLICETLSTFNDIRALMNDRGQRRFFGTRIDGVIYGNGACLFESGELERFERSLGNEDGVCYTSLGGAFRPKVSYLYWGSISRAAISAILDLYRANPGRNIRPFIPAYCAMLDAAYSRRLPAVPPAPESSFFLRLEPHFTPMQKSTYRQVLSDQLCIPTGIVTRRSLARRSRA